MQAIEIVAVVAVGGLVVIPLVQGILNERALARMVRLAAQEPIEPIDRPEIPAVVPNPMSERPKRRITVPLPGIPWQAPRVSPKSPAPVEESRKD